MKIKLLVTETVNSSGKCRHTHTGSGGTALWWVSVAPSEWGTTDE
jgi:hypothetical protein